LQFLRKHWHEGHVERAFGKKSGRGFIGQGKRNQERLSDWAGAKIAIGISRTKPKTRLSNVQTPTVRKPDIRRMGFHVVLLGSMLRTFKGDGALYGEVRLGLGLTRQQSV
jgi:hypothetical protein